MVIYILTQFSYVLFALLYKYPENHVHGNPGYWDLPKKTWEDLNPVFLGYESILVPHILHVLINSHRLSTCPNEMTKKFQNSKHLKKNHLGIL